MRAWFVKLKKKIMPEDYKAKYLYEKDRANRLETELLVLSEDLRMILKKVSVEKVPPRGY